MCPHTFATARSLSSTSWAIPGHSEPFFCSMLYKYSSAQSLRCHVLYTASWLLHSPFVLSFLHMEMAVSILLLTWFAQPLSFNLSPVCWFSHSIAFDLPVSPLLTTAGCCRCHEILKPVILSVSLSLSLPSPRLRINLYKTKNPKGSYITFHTIKV